MGILGKQHGKLVTPFCLFIFQYFFVHGEILEYRIYSNKRRASDCDFLLRFFIVNGCKCVKKIIVNVNAVNSVK